MRSDGALLDVHELKTYFKTEQGLLRAVDGVSFSMAAGETLCIVGESGCGKSVTAYSVLRLLKPPRGFIAGGSIMFRTTTGEDVDIVKLDQNGPKMRSIRGREIAMVFQEPMTSLNPIYTIGQQIGEVIRLHEGAGAEAAEARAVELLVKVGIAAPEQRVREYPHQMSGGMRQRVMVAMALACSPRLLIADEPTTALDVTIEAQILELFRNIQAESAMGLLLITHDLGVVGEVADSVAVMYLGRIVEKASCEVLFKNPLHPYTQALFRSIPRIGKRERLESIEGSVPPPYDIPAGCPFRPRCSRSFDRCSVELPPALELGEGHSAACWLYAKDARRE